MNPAPPVTRTRLTRSSPAAARWRAPGRRARRAPSGIRRAGPASAAATEASGHHEQPDALGLRLRDAEHGRRSTMIAAGRRAAASPVPSERTAYQAVGRPSATSEGDRRAEHPEVVRTARWRCRRGRRSRSPRSRRSGRSRWRRWRRRRKPRAPVAQRPRSRRARRRPLRCHATSAAHAPSARSAPSRRSYASASASAAADPRRPGLRAASSSGSAASRPSVAYSASAEATP